MVYSLRSIISKGVPHWSSRTCDLRSGCRTACIKAPLIFAGDDISVPSSLLLLASVVNTSWKNKKKRRNDKYPKWSSSFIRYEKKCKTQCSHNWKKTGEGRWKRTHKRPINFSFIAEFLMKRKCYVLWYSDKCFISDTCIDFIGWIKKLLELWEKFTSREIFKDETVRKYWRVAQWRIGKLCKRFWGIWASPFWQMGWMFDDRPYFMRYQTLNCYFMRMNLEYTEIVNDVVA